MTGRAPRRCTSLDQLAFNAVVKVYKSGGYLHYLSPSRGWCDRYKLLVRKTDRHPEESSDIRCLPSSKVLPLQERIEAVGDDADLKEVYDTERHLLYVACTRARDHLLITGVSPVSEFLDDLLAG